MNEHRDEMPSASRYWPRGGEVGEDPHLLTTSHFLPSSWAFSGGGEGTRTLEPLDCQSRHGFQLGPV